MRITALAVFVSFASTAVATDFAAFVNPRIGTSGTGHATVAAAYPLGMVQAGPDTGTESWDYASGYRDEDRSIFGFTHSHLNGTGVPELGDLLILPMAREEGSGKREERFDKSSETARPGYYAVTLEDGIRCEAAVSQRAAVWRFAYPEGARARLLVDMQWGLVWEKMDEHVLESAWTDGGANAISGWARTKGWTERRWNFALETDVPRVSVEVLPRQEPHRGARLVMDFGNIRTLTVRVALSTTTEDGARGNLAEVRGRSLEEVADAAREAWNGYLSRIEVPGADAASVTNVYTALYHLFWQPNDITDIDGAYRGADGKIARVEKGRRYFSTLSLWDTYRAAHPLYTIIAPELVDDFVRSMVAHQRATGCLPVWPVWGRETHCMIGNHAVPVLCEAVNKGLTSVPPEEVFAAIRATLRESHPGKPKEDWAVLDRHGYYPFDLVPEEGVSRTLEGAYDDWCAMRLAKRLGREEDAAFFGRRCEAWRNVFDPETRSVRGRASDGSWRTPFDPEQLFGYGVPRDISEANANQYAWHVQQDPDALAEAMGGKSAALAKLEEHFDHSRSPKGSVLDVTGLIGEYAHGNEPGHHVPYLFSLWGRPERTAEIVREVFDRFYRPTPDGLCGNDDCGQMSAWYLFSAMGFYPVEPTGGEYVIGAPQVPEAVMNLGGSRFVATAGASDGAKPVPPATFTVIARNLSRKNKYVKLAALDGKPLAGRDVRAAPILRHDDIVRGGELVFDMADASARDAETLVRVKAKAIAALRDASPRLPELRESLASCGADTGDSTVKSVMESVCPPSAAEVATLDASGRWPDVDYTTVSRSAWPIRVHLQRMKAIARAQRSGGSVAAFRRALGAWLRGGFRNPNWWWNEIGVPLELGAACLAMDDVLAPQERAEVVERLRESKIGMTGQNRIWLAECVLYRALIEGNATDAKAARDAIAGEVAMSDTVEGIQADWSFHQHGNQAQFGNYGASYIMSVPRLLRLFDGTAWAVGAEKAEILRNLVEKGFLPTVWKGSMDVGAIGRQLGRGAARAKGAAVLLAVDEVGGAAKVPRGLHWFPKSAYGVYRADGWMVSVKCETASIQGTEKVNEDNLLGAHLADGALFCYVTGDEYRDIFPLWNWRHVPGTTSYDIGTVDWKSRNREEYCVAEGDLMRFRLDRAGLRAETEWRFSPNGVEVSVTGVTATNGLSVVTTVEQSVAEPNASWRREGDGIVAVNGAIRYLLPSNAVVTIEERAGSWRRHMGAASDKEVRGRVFEITIPHGVNPSGAKCLWRVEFACSGKDVASVSAEKFSVSNFFTRPTCAARAKYDIMSPSLSRKEVSDMVSGPRYTGRDENRKSDLQEGAVIEDAKLKPSTRAEWHNT